MEVAILLFSGITALDAIGPYEVLSRLPASQIKFVAVQAGLVKTDNQMCTLVADYSLSQVPQPDVIVIPGGWGTDELMKDQTVLDWIRKAHTTSQWTTSVCTGSMVLAAAGLLKGKEATTHWTALGELESLGAIPIQKRFVKSGKIVTSAGVSAGIDMALQLASWIADEETAQAVQLGMEYDPCPPYDAGSPEKAGAAIIEKYRELKSNS